MDANEFLDKVVVELAGRSYPDYIKDGPPISPPRCAST
jgi:hypothetical protein